jgi:hypothetical protein
MDGKTDLECRVHLFSTPQISDGHLVTGQCSSLVSGEKCQLVKVSNLSEIIGTDTYRAT